MIYISISISISTSTSILYYIILSYYIILYYIILYYIYMQIYNTIFVDTSVVAVAGIEVNWFAQNITATSPPLVPCLYDFLGPS